MTDTTGDDVLAEVRVALRELKGEAVAGRPDLAMMKLTDDLGIDSLDLISILFRLEEKFGVKISDEDIDKYDLVQVGNLVAYVAERALRR
jgi:acyl carrier protein